MNISDLNSRAGYHGVVPVQLVLKPGDVNTLRFGVSGASGMSLSLSSLCVVFLPINLVYFISRRFRGLC